MKKILSILLVFVFCISLSACKDKNHILDIEAVQHHTEDYAFISRQQVAYYMAFHDIYKKQTNYLDDIKYLVLDIRNIEMEETKYLKDLFGTFAKEKNLVLFYDNKESLIDRKHIIDGEYKEGLILTYNDLEYSDKKIITELEVWHSENKKEKKKFTIEKISDNWVIRNVEEVS